MLREADLSDEVKVKHHNSSKMMDIFTLDNSVQAMKFPSMAQLPAPEDHGGEADDVERAPVAPVPTASNAPQVAHLDGESIFSLLRVYIYPNYHIVDCATLCHTQLSCVCSQLSCVCLTVLCRLCLRSYKLQMSSLPVV